MQNDSETEPGATERMVTLIGNKKATDMAYDLIKEVIDEVQLLTQPFWVETDAYVLDHVDIFAEDADFCIRLCVNRQFFFNLYCRFSIPSFLVIYTLMFAF